MEKNVKNKILCKKCKYFKNVYSKKEIKVIKDCTYTINSICSFTGCKIKIAPKEVENFFKLNKYEIFETNHYEILNKKNKCKYYKKKWWRI